VWSRIEIFFLQNAKGAEAVGLFSASLTLSNLAAQGPILLTAGLLPYFAASFGRGALDKMRETYATATRVLAFVVLPACFGLAAIMPEALPLIYGKAFTAAVPAAIILLVSAGVAAMSTVGSNLIFAAGRSDFIFASGVAAAVLSVVGGLTLVQSFGLMGAVCMRAGVQLVAAALGCWFVIRRLDCPIPFRDLGRIVIAAALCGAAARCTLLLPMRAASLPAAIVIGGAAYLLFSRLLRVLPPKDVARLRLLSCALPVRLHGIVDWLLRLVFECREELVDAAHQPQAARGSTQ
jgi:O-antigen/teichoic acid export membrane protein